ncbi:hypothetical protein GCM10007385_26500 [Tateyamaria omphalii]|uniref:hypothetical protein n=1 Tax=Tateyamaria omphalii TaxID=299262 RepID=UPI0016741169|nr:hypothetical protein [Tateyamaria omphalii]GGX56474.1 hypothetical protein GCM10007385_26500 [Tateyamaria omphalii]
MTTLAIVFSLLLMPLGVILRMRNLPMVLGVLIVLCVILSLYNLFAGTPGSPLFFAGPAALALMLGWTLGKRFGGRG